MRNLYKEQTKGEVADKLYIPPLSVIIMLYVYGLDMICDSGRLRPVLLFFFFLLLPVRENNLLCVYIYVWPAGHYTYEKPDVMDLMSICSLLYIFIRNNSWDIEKNVSAVSVFHH